jgi:hypothetical protein
MLRQYRAVVENAFPGRLRAMVAFESRVRGNTAADCDWHPAVFIENFEPSHDERRLYQLALPFEGSLAPSLGLTPKGPS